MLGRQLMAREHLEGVLDYVDIFFVTGDHNGVNEIVPVTGGGSIHVPACRRLHLPVELLVELCKGPHFRMGGMALLNLCGCSPDAPAKAEGKEKSEHVKVYRIGGEEELRNDRSVTRQQASRVPEAKVQCLHYLEGALCQYTDSNN